MAGFEVRQIDDQKVQSAWNEIVLSFEPLVDSLENPQDKAYFKSMVKLLIGKEIRLSNIPAKHMYIYMRRLDLILKSLRYPQLFPEEFLRSEIARMLFGLGIRISEDGLGWKYNPMTYSHQNVTQKQEVISKLGDPTQ
jgi:hypothetical protein